MKKANQLAQTISEGAFRGDGRWRLNIKVNGNGRGEGYVAKRWGDEIRVNAESPLAAAFAAAKLTVGMKSGHLQEFFGPCHPKCAMRPLWLLCDRVVELAPGLRLFAPSSLCNEKAVASLCLRTVELGYNALIFARSGECKIEEGNMDLLAVANEIAEYGLKLIVEPEWDKERSLDPLSDFGGVFWQSTIYERPFSFSSSPRDLTDAELALKEVAALEEALPSQLPLIYYIPVPDLEKARQQSHWVPTFCDDLGARTAVAFPAVAGAPCWDHLPWHPIWEVLRQQPDQSATPLLPVFNSGGLEQGEGLWPIVSLDLFDAISSRSCFPPFCGAIGLTAQVPKPGSFLHCNLWVAAQVLWHALSPSFLVESWFRAFCPELNYSALERLFKKAREIALHLGEMRWMIKQEKPLEREGARISAEELLGALKRLEYLVKEGDLPAFFVDYMRFFIRDGRRTIYYFLHHFHAPMAGILNGDDLGDAFWTTAVQGGGQGFSGSTEVRLNAQPSRGKIGSNQEKIYLSTREPY